MVDHDDDDDGGDAPGMLSRAEILRLALELHEEYRDKHRITLTLRGLYYQFVGRGLESKAALDVADKHGNNVGRKRLYKRMSKILSAARYAGEFPLDGLIDGGGREVNGGKYTTRDDDVDAAERGCRYAVKALPRTYIDWDRWIGQDTFLSVWVEKDALGSVISEPCDRAGVSWFALKGYPSVTSLNDWVETAAAACGDDRFGDGVGTCKRVVVLHFGDHDPDGLEIPRSVERNVRQLAELIGFDIDLTVKRLGLNMDQIQRYKPPPFEAPVNSARHASYIRETGSTDAWELDALDPAIMRKLLIDEIPRHFDEDAHRNAMADRDALREELRERMARPGWFKAAFAEPGDEPDEDDDVDQDQDDTDPDTDDDDDTGDDDGDPEE